MDLDYVSSTEIVLPYLMCVLKFSINENLDENSIPFR